MKELLIIGASFASDLAVLLFVLKKYGSECTPLTAFVQLHRCGA
jgi:hypothetical protein